MALAVVTGLVFGLVPALVVLRGNTWSLLKDDSTRGSAGRSTGLTRSALVVVGNGVRARAARRGWPAAQELHAAAERRPGIRDRPRADGADVAAARHAIPTPRHAARSGCGWSTRRARLPGVTSAGSDEQRAVQRQRVVGLVFDRRLHAGSDRGGAARPPGSRRRRLLRRDADPARSRAGSSTMATRPTARRSSSSISSSPTSTSRSAARSASRFSAAVPTARP